MRRNRLRLRRAVPLLAATTLGIFASTGVANAATFTVNDTTDAPLGTSTGTTCVSTHSNSCTLRAAVQAADNIGGANTITLPAGTYPLSIGPAAADDPSTGDLDVDQTNGASSPVQLTINGAGSGSTTIDADRIDRALAVHANQGLSLSGLTIANGLSSSPSTSAGLGGAIYSNGALALTGDVTLRDSFADNSGGAIFSDGDPGSTLTITGATFERNGTGDSEDGGAVYDGSPNSMSITKSLFRNNDATTTGAGGAVYNNGGPATVDQTTFASNTADQGGAIYWEANTSVSVTNSTFDGNVASTQGGAVYDNDSSSMTLSSDSFTHNSAPGGGGAVELNATSTTQYTLNHDVFDANIARNGDGGAVLWYYGQLTSTGSTFTNNAASLGGALSLENLFNHPQLTLTNATISGNLADSNGGGIYADSGGANPIPATLTNDTIAFNTAPSGDGGGIYDASGLELTNGSQTGNGVENTAVAKNTGGDCDPSDTFDSTFDQGHNLDSDASCFGGLGVSGDQTGVDPKLNGPAYNGGPVAGDPNTGQLPILTDAEQAGSPAIDGGTNSGCPATDARGVTRPQGASCDIGAFEAAPAHLSVSNSAPSTGATGIPFTYTITVGASGPGPSTGTVVTDQLPAGETLYGATPSQGSCSSSGTPAKVTCDLGLIANGNNATVTLLVAEANPGSVTDTATATNDQGENADASATTNVSAPVAPAGASGPKASTDGHAHVGKHSAKVKGHVSNGSQPTWFFFQYGRSRKLGSASKLVRISSSSNVSATIRHLLSGKKYFYRLVAINDSGKSFGSIHSFRTKRSHRRHHH
jgi:uncharacterized repeat protein (TIGR01451 family)